MAEPSIPTGRKRTLIKRGLSLALAITIIGLVLIWAVAVTGPFADIRKTVAEDLLSELLARPVRVKDDIKIEPGWPTTITFTQISVPNDDPAIGDMATIRAGRFHAGLRALLLGDLVVSNLELEGLTFKLIRDETGRPTWRSNPLPADSQPSKKLARTNESSAELVEFIVSSAISVRDLALNYEDKRGGWKIDFAVDEFSTRRDDAGNMSILAGTGSVNSAAFSVNGIFPDAGPFQLKANFGSLQTQLDGSKAPPDRPGEMDGTFSMSTESLGDLLAILDLKRTVEGAGRLTAAMSGGLDTMAARNIDLSIESADGDRNRIRGHISDLWDFSKIDIALDSDWVIDDAPLQDAKTLKDLRLVGLSTRLKGAVNDIEINDFVLHTNAFDHELRHIGPIGIERVLRTPDEKLGLYGVTLQAGPRDAPYLTANGEIRDVLTLSDIVLDGTVQIATAVIMGMPLNNRTETLGELDATFALTDASGTLGLTRFEVATRGNAPVRLKADLEVRDLAKFDGAVFTTDIIVPDTGAVMKLLGIKPIAIGALGFTGKIAGDGLDAKLNGVFTVGKSKINAALKNEIVGDRPVLSGAINAKSFHINDLSNLAIAGTRLSAAWSDDGGNNKGKSAKIPVPKPKPEPGQQTAESTEPVKPATETRRKVRELIAPDSKNSGGGIAGMFDLDLAINIGRIIGQKGVNSLSSKLLLKSGMLTFGPVNLAYGGGRFRTTAGINLLKSPNRMRISGRTDGWNLGSILSKKRTGVTVTGKLSADFDLTGNRRSIKSFLHSASGRATVFLSGGRIGSSLLDLAGMGVLPWLFSKSAQQGYSNIKCFIAPFAIKQGRASSSSMVMETEHVQVVARGTVDWRNNKINVTAEPRPVDRPLAESAYPFSVTGKLSKPTVSVIRNRPRNTAATTTNTAATTTNTNPDATKKPKKRKACSLGRSNRPKKKKTQTRKKR